MQMAPSFKFPVLNLFFNVVDGIGTLHVKGDGLAGECLNEDLRGIQRSTKLSTFETAGNNGSHRS